MIRKPPSVEHVERWLVAPTSATTPDRRALAVYIAWRAITDPPNTEPPSELAVIALALARDVLRDEES